MPPSTQVGLICIVAGVLIAFNLLVRVRPAGRGRRFKRGSSGVLPGVR